MNALHNMNDPFKTIIDQIKTAIDFSDAGKVPYMLQQVVTTAYDLIFVMGYSVDTCLLWNHNPVVNKTWVTFKICFAE